MATKHSGITKADLNAIKDKSVRDALTDALSDKKISDSEIDKIIASAMGDREKKNSKTNVARRLDDEEIKALWLIADKSKSLSSAGRDKLMSFLRGVSGSELMYKSAETDGSGILISPTYNFPGVGFRGMFRMRPRTKYDLHAKIHDLTFKVNGLSIDLSLRKKADVRSPLAQSRKAKADFIFRRLNTFSGDWSTASLFFDGDSAKEFVAGDGFINPITFPTIYTKLCNPRYSLTIPLNCLPENETKNLSKEKKYYTAVNYDYKVGFDKWLKGNYAQVWAILSIGSDTGPKFKES